VQPTPAITSISPSSGSIAGGTVVKISGTDTTAASAVKFGDTPAATLAGTSLTTGGDRFNYEACVVPKLKGNSAHHGQNRQRQDRDRDHREGGAGREPATAA
jgi:hypothetical protein